MSDDFYLKFKAYSKDQIFYVLELKNEFQPEAVKAATRILFENQWETEFAESIIEKEKAFQKEVEEKADYYRKAVEFQKERNFVNIRPGDIPRFEASLIENNIEFYREDKNIGPLLERYPTEKYYFKEKDAAVVDKICIDLQVAALPYADDKPFFSFHLKVWGIVILLGIILIIIINL